MSAAPAVWRADKCACGTGCGQPLLTADTRGKTRQAMRAGGLGARLPDVVARG
jgi:hypothetical protein